VQERVEALRASAEIKLDHDRVLGRAPGPGGVPLEHPRVSLRHAEVLRAGDKVILRDLNSSAGTFVNGERVSGARELQPSDWIDIDPFSFRFTGHSLLLASRKGKLGVIGRNLTTNVLDHANGKTKCILDDVSLVIEPGEFVCLLGASGSGKTTTMRALSARALGDRGAQVNGAVLLNGVNLYSNFQALKGSIALVPQKDVLYEDLPLRECLTYSARLRLPADTSPEEIGKAVDRALDRVGLSDLGATPIRHLSGGQKKRAALANETVSQPDLLFLDEVTSGLDEGTDWEMMDLFRRLAHHHDMTIICVTHTVANVHLSDKIAVMSPSEQDGRRGPGVLAYYGPPAGAKRWFEVENLGEIYRKLPAAEGKTARDQYHASDEFETYIGRGLRESPAAPIPDQRQPQPQTAPHAKAGEVWRQFRILATRYFRLIAADRTTLAIAAGQSALIALFLIMVYGASPAPPLQASLLFFLGISGFWCGCNNASKEIVKERALFKIERDVKLSLTAYFASKIVALVVLGVVQVALLFGLVRVLGSVPGDSLRQFLCMCVSVTVGTSCGLFISAIATSEDQASTLVPIALIPQILLSGIVVPQLRAVPDFVAHAVISGFWVSRSMTAVLAHAPRDVREAVLVLAAHTVCFWIASWWVLRNR